MILLFFIIAVGAVDYTKSYVLLKLRQLYLLKKMILIAIFKEINLKITGTPWLPPKNNLGILIGICKLFYKPSRL